MPRFILALFVVLQVRPTFFFKFYWCICTSSLRKYHKRLRKLLNLNLKVNLSLSHMLPLLRNQMGYRIPVSRFVKFLLSLLKQMKSCCYSLEVHVFLKKSSSSQGSKGFFGNMKEKLLKAIPSGNEMILPDDSKPTVSQAIMLSNYNSYYEMNHNY